MQLVRLIILAAAAATLEGETIVVRTNVQDVVRPDVLQTARTVAGQILAGAGVAVDWHGHSSKQIDVVIVRDAPRDLAEGAMAIAYPFAASGQRIRIFMDRVYTQHPNAKPAVMGKVLGHVLAHEVGHILLGNDHHGDSGVMKARWLGRDSLEMQWRPLGFSQAEVEMIQDNLRNR